MDNTKRWLVFFIVVVLCILFFKSNFLGLAVLNTTSNVTVRLPNSAPILGDLNDSLYVCENEKLFYLFNATDVDGDVLSASIIPQNPFFVFWISQSAPNTHSFAIVSGTLGKTSVGGVGSGYKVYSETVLVDDDYSESCCTDSEEIEITVIEINNQPEVEDIGVHTIWIQGENSSFYEEWEVNDTEYELGYGNLTYNISIVNSSGVDVELFNISSEGIMDFNSNESVVADVYNVTVCVQDTGLGIVHNKIDEKCGQDGSAFLVCDNFSLTITGENREPNITDYSPENLNLEIPGTQTLNFNITKYDADGTIPDAYWYKDGVFQEKDEGSSVDEFSYNFGCGVFGNATFKVEITDGIANDSVEWIVNYTLVACPPPTSSGGGGGGGGNQGFSSFNVYPEFITTSVFQEEGKTFDIQINNTGTKFLNIETEIENISEMSILSDEEIGIAPGETKNIRLYLYALSNTQQDVYFGKIKFKSGYVEKSISVVLEVKEREALFDIKVSVPDEYKVVNAGDNIKTLVDMLNVGLYGTAVDVELYLYITDFDKILIYETSKEIIAVETNVSIERELYVPFSTASGTYLVLGEAKYQNITVTTYDTFSVIEKKYLRASYFIIAIVIIMLIAFILFLLWKRRKDRKERGYR